MAVLGKRKAREPTISQDDADDIFRRHFESQFTPLDDAPKKKKVVAEAENEDSDDSSEDEHGANQTDEDEEDEDSEWGGVSDDEVSDDDDNEDDAPTIEVVDHSSSQTPKPVAMSKRDLKAFMSSRPPDQTASSKSQPTTQQPSSSTLPEDAPSLLAQDLELRRLLSESHLLASPSLTSSSSASGEPRTFASGRIRQKATDMRVQALGSKTSILKQEKMPMNMRKGIVAAAGARESKRRREARENGIVLERETGGKKRTARRRDMGVDRPGMGKFKGAELRLNDRDVKSIEGSRDVFGRRDGRGGRGGKRR